VLAVIFQIINKNHIKSLACLKFLEHLLGLAKLHVEITAARGATSAASALLAGKSSHAIRSVGLALTGPTVPEHK
jgi:hypothetical protein